MTLASGTGYGGFFLTPFTGPINGSAGSAGSPEHLPPALPPPAGPAPASAAAAAVPRPPATAALIPGFSLWNLLLRTAASGGRAGHTHPVASW